MRTRRRWQACKSTTSGSNHLTKTYALTFPIESNTDLAKLATATDFEMPTAMPGDFKMAPSSIISVLITAVPPSFYSQMGDPDARSSVYKDIHEGHFPDWYKELPNSVKTYISTAYQTDAPSKLTGDSKPTSYSSSENDSASSSKEGSSSGSSSSSSTDSDSVLIAFCHLREYRRAYGYLNRWHGWRSWCSGLGYYALI